MVNVISPLSCLTCPVTLSSSPPLLPPLSFSLPLSLSPSYPIKPFHLLYSSLPFLQSINNNQAATRREGEKKQAAHAGPPFLQPLLAGHASAVPCCLPASIPCFLLHLFLSLFTLLFSVFLLSLLLSGFFFLFLCHGHFVATRRELLGHGE